MTAPAHDGTVFAGQTLEWLGTDTLASWQRYMQDPEHRDYFQQQGWDRSDAISYRINTDGFRGEEFGTGEYLLALGCSHTLGIGLPESAVWPYIVSKSLKLQVANVSWGGYSADTCFRLAEYWIPQLKPKLVVMMAPPVSRFEIMLDPEQLLSYQNREQSFEVVRPASLSTVVTDSPLIRHWFGNQENHRLNNRRNCLAVQALCNELDISCVVDNVDHHMWWSREELGYARDFMHGGPPAHQKIAEHVLGCLQP